MKFQHIFKETIFYAWFEAMHTRIDIVLCNLSETGSIILTEKLQNEIDRIENLSNCFNPKSEISLINCHAEHGPFKISNELYSIIEVCICHNEKTAGAFDITVNSKNNHRGGIHDIVLHSEEKTIFFKHKNVQIDLCGYIKGYALDKIKNVLLENNCTDALVSMGNSSILALGNHPNGKGWKVKRPEKTDESIVLYDECLTSSGNTAEHIHIINPQIGNRIKDIKTVSVVTKSGTEGEVNSLTHFIESTQDIQK